MTGERMEYATDSPDATEALGRAIGAVVEPGDVLGVDGDLGAGKTCLIRGIASGVGVNPELVRSPTFVLHHVYSGGRLPLHHLDCYRLGADTDLSTFDLDDLLADGAVAVEWFEYALPIDATSVRVAIAIGDGDRRTVSMSGDAPVRLRDAWHNAVRLGAS